MKHPHSTRRRKVLSRGVSLVEFLTVLIIVALVVSVSVMGLGRAKSLNLLMQMRSEVAAALQSSVVLLNQYQKPDADNGEPRLAGVTYGGTAVFFDNANGLIRFANNNQFAEDATQPSNIPKRHVELQTFTQNGQTWGKKAYTFIKSVEPVAIKNGVGIVGVVRDDNGTPTDPSDDTLRMVPMPFAVCCGPDTYGLPIAPFVFADLKGNGTWQQIATAHPAVILFIRDDISKIGANPDDLSTLPGATDQAKIQTLLLRCGGQLVELSIQNGSEMNT